MVKITSRAAAILLLLALLAGGCLPSFIPTEEPVGPNGETLTPTLNATQQAIAVMLTETRAAPTITNTPIVTPTTTPTPTATTPPVGSSERPVSIGQPVAVEGAALTVLSTSTPDTVGKVKASKDIAFLDVEVIVENRSSADLDYTPLYFLLHDAAGAEYQPLSGAVWPALQSGTLRAGEWARGHVTFQVPPNAAGSGTSFRRLSYSPQLASGQAVALWVDLTQLTAKAAMPETGPIATSQPLPGVGKRVEAGGIALTVEQVAASQRVQYTKAGAGNVLVVLTLTIENVSRPRAPYNPEYFAVKDYEGYEYPAIIIPAEELIQAGSLGQGQKVSGQVVFEAPARDTRLVVEYQPQVLFDAYPEIRVGIEVPSK